MENHRMQYWKVIREQIRIKFGILLKFYMFNFALLIWYVKYILLQIMMFQS